ncbi:MAG TPA: hypothetical protein PLL20_06800 [Phycisphaerae bacterium]|nr:hypothetical protein [Phycisphaerae bacterium]HRR84125.1 hypothetical protein [Phycisphaerae bacterium]
MSDSPIVQEVRRRAMEISARFDHDLDRYVEHLREYQEQFRDRLVSQITVVQSPRHGQEVGKPK